MKKVLVYCANLCYSLFRIGYSKGVGKMKKYSACDIATWFIYKNNAEKREIQAKNDNYEVYEDLTHLKLQKLLYFAQGICLSITGEPLFTEDIEAWGHGPVVKKIFNKFSSKGREEITIDDSLSDIKVIRNIEADSCARDVLNMTYENFAIYTAWQLRNMTHKKNSPWDISYVPNKNKVIPQKLIKEYFDKEIME